MAIKPVCDKCKKELTDFGGILFSPPDEKSMVKKYHICKPCFKKMVEEFK
jgi:hypothetical protein